MNKPLKKIGLLFIIISSIYGWRESQLSDARKEGYSKGYSDGYEAQKKESQIEYDKIISEYQNKIKNQRKEFETKLTNQKNEYNEKIQISKSEGISKGRSEKQSEVETNISQKAKENEKKGKWNEVLYDVN